jgi:predicted AlkP superfamily pyrophosphatase or phosphodiesterase
MSNKSHLVLINVVGLTPSLLGSDTPNLNRLIDKGFMSPMEGVFPALTTTAQSSMVTGLKPSQHGIVGNGWYERDYSEVMFWKQSNRLVQGEKIWDQLRAASDDFRCSKLFWWYNMYANVDASITPRPHYPADGRKIIDLYSTPNGLHEQMEAKLGKFPFFNFWGPKAGIESSRWIAQAAMLEFDLNKPHLQLIYLPHLDYCLQKLGPNGDTIRAEVKAIDQVIGELMDFFEPHGAQLMIVSEYGIEAVDTPVHINRVLRNNGYVAIRESLTWELLDPGASKAFAVSDHQVAHVYVNDSRDVNAVKKLLEQTPGIERVLDQDGKKEFAIDHARSGDLIAVAEPNAWFTYYYWLDDNKAPDFARTVDIHRKPGYDPVEMFVDPDLSLPMAKVAWRLLQKTLGFRMLMDVIPLKPELIRGSHGRAPSSKDNGPLIIAPKSMARENIDMCDVPALVRGALA